jgi:hypothetical protein
MTSARNATTLSQHQQNFTSIPPHGHASISDATLASHARLCEGNIKPCALYESLALSSREETHESFVSSTAA